MANLKVALDRVIYRLNDKDVAAEPDTVFDAPKEVPAYSVREATAEELAAYSFANGETLTLEKPTSTSTKKTD
ncbi:hypothetical protein [Sphingomonas sp. TREG-RG-20F-R18-01]|uniref:hypothetical protein n=1 Tax=Sphingomonas sp. TREG-RG-20F-R18-01 TaxID=2914982 RepID=UPI001F5AF4BA|nr:hypothetical protein [Sphingomonas sp. TREG-RG-20F-R18-01]